MGGLRPKVVATGLISTLSFSALAQTQLPLNDPSQNAVQPTVGGVGAVDLVQLSRVTLGVPLRHAGIVVGSEHVDLNGRDLRKGDEYSIDYGAGIIYLKVTPRVGDAVRVSYRYDPAKANATSSGGGVPNFRLNLTPGGQIGFVAGLGVAERTADGRVLSSNVFGFNTNFSMGPKSSGSLKGVVFFSDRQAVDSQSLIAPEATGSDQGGSSHAILQDLNTSVGKGGKISLSYQDIGKGFTAMNAFSGAGYTDGQVGQLGKEKGLKRFGFGLTDIGVDGFKFSNGLKVVQDGKNSITWRSGGIKVGDFSFGYTSQKVDRGFTRFRDIAEGDRDQLGREAGMARLGFAGGFGKQFGFNSSKIDDGNGNSIQRRELSLDMLGFKYRMGDQYVQSGFGRIASLKPEEQALFRTESGLRRDWMSFSIAGKANQASPFSFASNNVRSDGGEYRATDLNLNAGGISIEHSNRDISQGFGHTGSLQPQEILDDLNKVARMYDPNGIPIRPEDRQRYIQQSGIGRSLWRIGLAPLKGWSAGFQTLRLKGRQDGADVLSAFLKGKGASFTFRSERIGKDFNELNGLMLFERDRLGIMTNFAKTDWTVETKNFQLSQMVAKRGDSVASRGSLHASGKTFDLSVNQRRVDAAFADVNQIVDPEKDLLASLIGQKGTQAKLQWRPWRGMSINAESVDLTGSGIQRNRDFKNLDIQWNPRKGTELGYLYVKNRTDDPTQLLFYSGLERFTLKQDLGHGLQFRFLDEKQQFDGTWTNQPNASKQFFALAGPINKTTKFGIERSHTTYDDGTSETVQANTLQTQLSPKAGLSVTQTTADRPGTAGDERHGDVGAWLILPNGMKLTYGYVRNLNGQGTGNNDENVSITGGTVGNVQVGDSGYIEKNWDADHRRVAQSNLSLSSVKPFKMGLLHNFKWNFGFNALRDRGAWQAENRNFAFSADLGSNSIAYEYKSQIWSNQMRGIDRTFKFSTDQSPNRFFTASVFYKLRTLPWDAQVMIRDYNFTLRPTKNMELTHQLLTNPDRANGGVLLGSMATPERRNVWKLDYKANQNFTFGASWQEIRNDQNHALSRVAGVNATLFNANGSPLRLFFGVDEQAGNVERRTTYRYSIDFTQRAGPNQSFSFTLGNMAFEHSIAAGQHRNNWTGRLDYTLRF